MIALVAASGAMAVALPVSAAFAADGASADGSAADSPGLISGNGIQLPVHVPVNLCGNTVNVVGLLNPAAGNGCANTGGTAQAGSAASGGASAHGTAQDSPGVLSGNGVQLPVHVPVNVCGNTVNVVGLLNPAAGNGCANAGTVAQPPRSRPSTPPVSTPPVSTPPVSRPPVSTPPVSTPRVSTPRVSTPRGSVKRRLAPAAPRQTVSSLAHTGADVTLPAVAGSAALLLSGAILYRRFRPARTS
ncbi:chaplin [Streptomyces sp. CoH27]|uniref:chaplin n=1 Tax=Streptomyces sp. CoH27 TaxID=2875763 RepID=UPI001CD1BDB8|nr:chaplin [Streptomyces sp. CoH27]